MDTKNSHPSWSYFHCVSSHFLSCHSGLNVIELAADCLLRNVPVERVQLLKYEADDSELFIDPYSIVQKKKSNPLSHTHHLSVFCPKGIVWQLDVTLSVACTDTALLHCALSL